MTDTKTTIENRLTSQRKKNFFSMLGEKLITGGFMRVFGEYKWQNETYAKYFFEEVEDEIKILRAFKNDYKTFSKRKIFTEIRDIIVKKYSESYCPSNLFFWFNTQNKLKYKSLREEI